MQPHPPLRAAPRKRWTRIHSSGRRTFLRSNSHCLSSARNRCFSKTGRSRSLTSVIPFELLRRVAKSRESPGRFPTLVGVRRREPESRLQQQYPQRGRGGTGSMFSPAPGAAGGSGGQEKRNIGSQLRRQFVQRLNSEFEIMQPVQSQKVAAASLLPPAESGTVGDSFFGGKSSICSRFQRRIHRL